MKQYPAKKRFGQNFLVDENIIEKIVQAISPRAQDHLVEIGPGRGALTFPLLPKVAKLDAVELDKDLIPLLQKSKAGNLVVHEHDILTFDLHTLETQSKSLRVVGNLPYNISTPLLFHLFEQKALILDMHFMLQREVAQRLAAKPGSKQYGRLTVMAQYHCDVEILFSVPPHSFQPAPQVHSSFIRMIPKEPSLVAKNSHSLDIVTKTAFSKRRKTIHNALKGVITTEQLASLGINPQDRPEQLSLESYVKISNTIS